jgi:hypothetical protein
MRLRALQVFFLIGEYFFLLVSFIPLCHLFALCHLFVVSALHKMAHEKSKNENLKVIESLLPSLSQEEKLDLFAKFSKTGKSSPLTTTNSFTTGFTKPMNGSLKRSSDASKLSLSVASIKVSIWVLKIDLI